MKRLAPLVVMSLFAVQVSAQERTSDELLQLQKTVSSLEYRIGLLERALATVQTQLAAPPATVGFKQVGPLAYAFEPGPGYTLNFRVAKLTVHADTDISMKAGSSAVLESGASVLVKAGSTATVESLNIMSIKTGGPMTIRSSDTMDLMGSMVKLNMGARPALPLGTQITCPSDGGSAVVVPSQFTVLIP